MTTAAKENLASASRLLGWAEFNFSKGKETAGFTLTFKAAQCLVAVLDELDSETAAEVSERLVRVLIQKKEPV